MAPGRSADGLCTAQRFGIGFTALGFPVLVPGNARSQGEKGVVTGGQGQALPTLSSPLHQGHTTGVVGRPGGVDAEAQGWWGLGQRLGAFRSRALLYW